MFTDQICWIFQTKQVFSNKSTVCLDLFFLLKSPASDILVESLDYCLLHQLFKVKHTHTVQYMHGHNNK